MPLETGNVIENLDQSSPYPGEPVHLGDDHLRLIKAVLKNQFPGVLGDGYAIPITATEAELNYLTGTTSNVNANIAALQAGQASLSVNLNAPKNTRMTFFQVATPIGWTQVTTYNDYMMRVVQSAGGGVGGTESPTSINFSHAHTTNGHVLTIAEMPAHTHGAISGQDSQFGTHFDATSVTNNGIINTQSAGGGEAHGHGNTGTTNLTWSPKYINIIIGTKS